MPELPEVETMVRNLRQAGLKGLRIRQVGIHWDRLIAGLSPRVFIRRLKDRTFLDINRRGKFIVFRLSGGYFLLVHLRMTGQFVLRSTADPRDSHEHLVLRLNDGRELRYRDTRKFGRWCLTRNPKPILHPLGPEPLAASFQLPDFAAGLAGCRRMLKPLLLDQTFIAGLGNIYADEALWEARLHPQRRPDTLKPNEVQALYQAIRRTLKRGIRHGGTSLGAGQSHFANLSGRPGRHHRYLKAYGRTGQPCPRCHTPIRRLTIGQRSSHICPVCQR